MAESRGRKNHTVVSQRSGLCLSPQGALGWSQSSAVPSEARGFPLPPVGSLWTWDGPNWAPPGISGEAAGARVRLTLWGSVWL